MAANTPYTYNSLVIYEVYVRNHTPEGTFKAFDADLDRIQALGVDVIWFMPIHPIGKINKKGGLGCPYSISDYRAVNPEYGSLEDFKHTIQAIHARGMKVMIDVVYNHTAHDSLLVRDYPHFFHQDASGRPVTTVPNWSDVIDLLHPEPELSQYLIDSLKFWVSLGVDGFRCDVASLVPVEFWTEARRQVTELNPKVIWLAESVHAAFIEFRRKAGLSGYSDSELYQAFDLTYDYDIWPILHKAIAGSVPPARLLEMHRFQEAIYPGTYVKMHCTENHDQPRVMSVAPSRDAALAWTAFEAFNKGAFLIYAGQESEAAHTPTLFDRDLVDWGSYPLTGFFTNLFKVKHHPLVLEGVFNILQAEPVILAAYAAESASLLGIFNPSSHGAEAALPLKDGDYPDLLNGGTISVRSGKARLTAPAMILEVPQALSIEPFRSSLMDEDREYI